MTFIQKMHTMSLSSSKKAEILIWCFLLCGIDYDLLPVHIHGVFVLNEIILIQYNHCDDTSSWR